MTYYFTYGLGDPAETKQAFQCGWTEVEAPDINTAIKAYETFHPADERGVMPCCSVAFTADQMGKMLINGNGGVFCHDRIKCSYEVVG